MFNRTPEQADIALEEQDEDEPVEVLPDGTIRPVQQASEPGEKPVILRDPRGEYKMLFCRPVFPALNIINRANYQLL